MELGLIRDAQEVNRILNGLKEYLLSQSEGHNGSNKENKSEILNSRPQIIQDRSHC